MVHVSDRASNPFGMRSPFVRVSDDPPAVFGYGDVSADVLVVGDHPGKHGGAETGVPFTEYPELLEVLAELGLLEGPLEAPRCSNCYLTYRHPPRLPDDRAPTPEEYAACERYLDAEVRAINPHIILPVGSGPTEHVLEEYTTSQFDGPLHATSIFGRGFLVIPVAEPSEWTSEDRDALVTHLAAVLAGDYRQTKGRQSR